MIANHSYFGYGLFPLREGHTHDGNVLLVWGLWEVPQADNDDEWVDE